MSYLRPALVLMLAMTLLTGLAYPLAVTGIAQVIFPWQADGSLIVKDGKPVGSALIAQNFTAARYFHPRPSAISPPYDANQSGGSNLGPTATAQEKAVAARVKALAAENPGAPIPQDLLTASASGLDPDISPAAALFQVKRVAAARHMPEAALQALVDRQIEPSLLGFIGPETVNVLRLNLALDGLAASKGASR
jgi:K+-transporting ATPase ATPase C chain